MPSKGRAVARLGKNRGQKSGRDQKEMRRDYGETVNSLDNRLS
jgi:hypothetical protein